MITTADAIAQRIFDLLVAAPGRPLGFPVEKLQDHPMLPSDPSELPAVAVYLTEGDTPDDYESSLSTKRSCKVAVEVVVQAEHPLRGTLPFRTWICSTLEADQTLGGLVDETLYQGFKPYGDVKDLWIAGAILTFEPHYLWRAS